MLSLRVDICTYCLSKRYIYTDDRNTSACVRSQDQTRSRVTLYLGWAPQIELPAVSHTQPQTGTETTTGIVCLAFGEPPTPDREQVLAYLERIFLTSTARTRVDPDNERAQQLARRRAPALLTEYKTMGGSPYNAQSREQVTTVGDQLRDRGYEVETYLGLQHTEPLIETAVERAWDDDVDRLIGVPLYPLCGPSTTVSAVADLAAAAEDVDGEIDLQALTGWHRHPTYTQLRAENIADTLNERSVALADEQPVLVFSAHGTPVRHLAAGSRYDRYVEDHCAAVAARLGVDEYVIGYQNHQHGAADWTEPEITDLVTGLGADRAVIEPISFLHEQSETLIDLDDELRAAAPDELTLVRVPVPHGDSRLGVVIADLLGPLLAGAGLEHSRLGRCRCCATPGTVCLNAPQEPPADR